MPKERCDLQGNIIANKANQTSKEIIIQLDNKDKREDKEYNKLQVEFNANS